MFIFVLILQSFIGVVPIADFGMEERTKGSRKKGSGKTQFLPSLTLISLSEFHSEIRIQKKFLGGQPQGLPLHRHIRYSLFFSPPRFSMLTPHS
jgi:hypothetical protein